jgi:hypothetical protein
VLLICLFWGCSFNNNTVKNANGNSEEVLPIPETDDRWENTPLMTHQYILEHELATEEDLAEIDVERMITECNWYEGTENRINVSRMIIMLKDDYLLDEYAFDYSYLMGNTEPEDTFTEDDIEQIKIVAYAYNNASMIFDFSEKKGYFEIGEHLFERRAYPEKYIELSDEQITEIKNLMQNCEVSEWKRSYEGSYDSHDSDWGWWHLYYELEDGRIYSNSGGGICDELPEKLMDLQNSLEAFFDSIK